MIRQRNYSSLMMAFVMVALLGLTACTVAETEATTPAELAPGEASESAGVLEPDVAGVRENLPADFQVTLYQGTELAEGEQVMFSEMVARGQPVVLNFWAGLCPPCRLEMPDLQAVSDEYEDRILLFGLDVGPFTGLGTQEDGRALINSLEVTYPAGATADGTILREYEIRGMPTTYFILPDGQVFDTWTGLLTEAKLAEIVDEMLAASAGS